MFESLKERNYNLRELCREADVTERTVRYYIKEGLLPPPHGSGPFSRYGYEHWLRLAFIKRLKDEYLPLSEIKNLLDSRSTAELDQLARQNGIISVGNTAPRTQTASPVLPGASSGANESAGAVSNSADALQGLLGGVEGGRARMLREQMGPPPAARGLSYGAAPAQSSAPRARSVAESAASMTPMPAQEPDFYEAPLVARSAFMLELDANFDIDTFADVPGAASMSMAFPEPDAAKEMISADDELETDEVTLPPPSPPPSYNAPSAYRTSSPPQSFMAGSAAPVQGPMPAPGSAPAPEKPSASMPIGGFNRSAQAPASPQRAMRMSRFAAPEFSRNEVAFDSDAVNSDFGADMASENIPLEPLAEKIVLPEPSASMRMMAKMAPTAKPAPVPLVPTPESADETVTGQTWERIEIVPGVELHIEKRIAETHRPALANLAQVARRLFGPKEI